MEHFNKDPLMRIAELEDGSVRLKMFKSLQGNSCKVYVKRGFPNGNVELSFCDDRENFSCTINLSIEETNELSGMLRKAANASEQEWRSNEK